MILFALFGLGFLAGAIALFATRNGGGSRSGKETGAVVFALVTLVFVLLAWWSYRRTVSDGPELRGVSLDLDRTEFRRGEQVNVSLSCDAAEHLEVGFLCTQFADVKRQAVDSNGYTHDVRSINKSNVVEEWRQVPEGAQAQSFTFEIPAGGPFSYEGATVSWAYQVSVLTPRALRSDPHHKVPIWVRA